QHKEDENVPLEIFILDIARVFREKRDFADRAQARPRAIPTERAVKPANLPVARTRTKRPSNKMSTRGIGKRSGVHAAGRSWDCLFAVMIGLVAVGWSNALAADHIRVATLKTGTLAWELEVVRVHGLDVEANLTIDALELGSTEGGKIALKGGAADVIVSDWLWVARERALGDNLMFYPYSSALGAVMVPADLPIKNVGDLKGRKLGVAAG